jgi:hypothetical protein
MSRRGQIAYLRHEFTKAQLHELVDRWRELADDIVSGKPVDLAEYDRLATLLRPFWPWWSPKAWVARAVAGWFRRKAGLPK